MIYRNRLHTLATAITDGSARAADVAEFARLTSHVLGHGARELIGEMFAALPAQERGRVLGELETIHRRETAERGAA